MPTRKRNHEEMSTPPPAEPPSLLKQIRDTWEFANVMQFIQIFGDALKIDPELDIEVLEEECLRPTSSEKLAQLGLTMLKWISSHRGLTLEIFDEYTRRQYVAKAPHRNPYGTDEEPAKFADFDIFMKLKILHQLSVWTLWNADRMRERMDEKDAAQTQWRIEPFGWDAQSRTYFLLDDNRLYRLTDAPEPEATPKPKPKPKSKPKSTPSRRSSKRQKLASRESPEEDDGPEEGESSAIEHASRDNGLDGAKWECVAVSHEDFTTFVDSLKKSRNVNEKELYASLMESVMPMIEKAAEARERREQKRLRELEALQKLASAKRSGRLADKQEKQRQAEEAAEADRKRQVELEMAHKEQEKQLKIEEARESRMMTREQRLKDREVKRILHEEELLKIKERSQSVDSDARMSERHRKAQLEKKERELQEIKQELEDDSWYFDCAICGKHGKNFDDGTHSLACEKCGVWQHSACHGIKEADAERDDFHFLCAACSKHKIKSLKILSSPSSSQTPPVINGNVRPSSQAGAHVGKMQNAASAGPPKGQFSTFQPPRQPSQPTYQPNGYVPQPQPPTYMGPQVSQSNGYLLAQPSSQTSYTNPQSAHAYQAHPQSLPQYSQSHPSPQRPTSSGNPPPPASPSHMQNHNPFTNAFSRQGRPPASSTALGHPSYISSESAASPQPHRSQQSQPPTPSLSATQGNTDVRFSPTQQPQHGASAMHTSPAASAQAYSPTSGRPAASAYSPTKHDMPRQPFGSPAQSWSFEQRNTISHTPNHHHNQTSSYHSPGLPQDATPARLMASPQTHMTGLSPVKHDAPSPRTELQGPPSGLATATKPTHETPARAPSLSMSSASPLGNAPTLTPSVNTGHDTGNVVPVKKMTPEKPLSPPKQLSHPDTIMMNGTDGGQ